MIANLFYTYLCTTALITFLLQARVFGVSFKYLLSYFINNSYLVNNLESLNDYEDFVPYWYVDIGYQLCFTWAILAVQVPVIGPITCYLFECFS